MKEDLQKLIEKIQSESGMTMQEISIKAGYGENYLSEQISKNNVSKKLYAKVQGIADTAGTFIKDAAGLMLQNQVELMATNRVILSILAEIQAPLAKRLPTELANIYRRMVKDEAEQVRKELGLK